MNTKETEVAATTTRPVMITKRPALMITASGAVMTAVAIAVALLGLHIQVLCLQFVYVILNHLKVSTRFELVGKIWHKMCELQNGFRVNLDDSFNSYTSKVLMSVSHE